MIKLYFDENFKLVDRDIPDSIVQYSTEDIEVYTQFAETYALNFNYVRPDGKQVSPVTLGYDRVEGEYDVWVGELTQFHTAYMPGNADTLVSLLSMAAMRVSDSAMKNSPIIRINITRGIEPLTEAIEAGLAASLSGRMTIIEEGMEDYSTIVYVDEEILNKTSVTKVDTSPLTELQLLVFLFNADNGIYKAETERNGSEMLFKSVVAIDETTQELRYGRLLANGASYEYNETLTNWVLAAGAGGGELISIPGPQGVPGLDGVDGASVYIHYAYADSADGSVGFSLTDGENKLYMGIYSNLIEADSTNPESYEWTLIKGADGADGTDGVSGQSGYLHIAYAKSSDGATGFSISHFEGAGYIGVYTNFSATDSTNFTDYKWNLIKGEDGANGTDGTDGLSSYLHIAYATSSDGGTGFSTTISEGKTYMGTYTDFTITDSSVASDYDWTLIKGADGVNGDQLYLHIAYATADDGSVGFSTTIATEKTYIGTYTDTVEADSTNPTYYTWALFKGIDGTDGADGTSVVILGSVATTGNLPGGASVGDLYIVIADGDGYVWNGSGWDNTGPIQGPDGPIGPSGLNAYVHYAYATSSDGTAGFSLTSFIGAKYVGTYTDFTSPDSTTAGDYTWSLFVGADGLDGADGNDGLPSYVHYAYATAADGSTGFSTTYTGTETYVGFYTDFTLADSTNYTDYEWSLFKGTDGANGLDGADGSNGEPVFIHFAYATAANGSTGFSTTYTGTEGYVGTYWDYTELDSTNYTDYDWSLFKGADGADGSDGTNGVDAFIHYAYATAANGSTGFSLTYTGVEIHIGHYTDATEADSTDYTDYEWSRFVGADGADGADGTDGVNGTAGTDGLNAYVHYAYARSSSGSLGFSTTYTGVENYVGVLSDNTVGDSTNYEDYEWSLFKGVDGSDGSDGSDGEDGAAGADGDDGADGSDGAGLVFRGEWDTNAIYYKTDVRADVVKYGSTYYVCKLTTTTSTASPNVATARWTNFGAQFDSVATNILLTEDASILKGLVMGDSTTSTEPFIRSYYKTSLSGGVGFYLSGNGTFNLGSSTNYMDWDGSDLTIKGHIEADSGEIGGWTIDNDQLEGATALFNRTDLWFATDIDRHIPSSLNNNEDSLGITRNALGIYTKNSSGVLSSLTLAPDDITSVGGLGIGIDGDLDVVVDSDFNITTDNLIVNGSKIVPIEYTSVNDWTETQVGTKVGGATKTYIEDGVYRVDLSITFVLTSDIATDGAIVFDDLPAGFRPTEDVWGLLGMNPGIDYENVVATYYEIEVDGDIKIRATTTAQDPITIQATYFRTS